KIINTIDYLTIKRLDYYVLFLACYLHDISMVIHPDLNKFCISSKASDNIYSQWMKDVGTELFRLSDYSTQEVKKIILDYFKRVFDYFEIDIRNNHANESALFIKEKHDTEYLKHINTAVLDIVAEISASHGYNSTEVYGRKASSKDDFYSKKYMMILIRLADLLDMSKERVSYYILKENIAHMSSTSQFHWISHLITDTCVLEAKYKIPKKRKDPVLRKGVIEETIYFNLYVNVKHQTSFPSRKCKFRDCIHKSKQLNITINMTSCRQRECTLLCSWMAKKHEYLFNELYALNKYLDTVNSGLFKTKFCVNIIYNDRKELDPEFRDIIFNYLEENKN
ncbi:MAG: HD domain-containing protein, partial [Tannerellaceae bacterium]